MDDADDDYWNTSETKAQALSFDDDVVRQFCLCTKFLMCLMPTRKKVSVCCFATARYRSTFKLDGLAGV